MTNEADPAEAIGHYFDGKPETYKIFRAIHDYVQALGPVEVFVSSQISFGVNRRFAWFWLYNVTQKNPSGILHTMLRMDKRIDDPHIRNITEIGTTRWNHQIVIRTVQEARSGWLRKLMRAAYSFGSG